MRKKLKKIKGKRLKFLGEFKRFGEKSSWKGPPSKTILLINIKDSNGETVSDHLWFNYTKGFQKLNELDPGDIIEFHARVRPYVKGYVNYREYIDMRAVDYKLSHPTKIKRIKRAT